MSIDLATVRKIASLSRLRIPEADQPKVAQELNGILSWVEQLNEVDVTGIAPLANVNDGTLRQRADEITDGACADAVLANAPSKTADFFTVPKVIE